MLYSQKSYELYVVVVDTCQTLSSWSFSFITILHMSDPCYLMYLPPLNLVLGRMFGHPVGSSIRSMLPSNVLYHTHYVATHVGLFLCRVLCDPASN